MTEQTQRQRFEEWISSFPYERNTTRIPNLPRYFAWPDQYIDANVQVAWEAWNEALTDPTPSGD